MGPLRTFRIGAVLQKRVKRRSSWAEPIRDRSRARPLAVARRRGDGKESVRCRDGSSYGPGYRQHRVPGIWGQSGTLWGMVSVLRYRECAICRAGRGGWGLDSVREIGTGSVGLSGIASRAPACSLWSAIAETASRSARAARGMEMPKPYIAHSGEAEGARIHEKWTDALGNSTIIQVQEGGQGTLMVSDP